MQTDTRTAGEAVRVNQPTISDIAEEIAVCGLGQAPGYPALLPLSHSRYFFVCPGMVTG